MKYLPLIPLTLFLLLACGGPKETLTFSGIEERIMDTLVVTAPRFDETEGELMDELSEENYTLPAFNESARRAFDLLHTKLEVRFDWATEQVIGKATLKLTPYFYATDSMVLDAKGFEFNQVRELGAKADLKYNYDEQQITLYFDRKLTRKDTVDIFIDYIATPRAAGGSAAITSDKGLFFINPTGEEDKPQQIWTQGETEHNSRWFPTIDKPNERTTQEIYITVQDKYKTLSNGLLMSSTDNGDGTRTDYWKMDQPHAPYLFMLTVGEFAVVKDRWNEIPLEYYVEEEYRELARQIFPYTPDMLTLFSEKLGVKYPWQKYSQVVVRDYVSGAMENTTAVIFGEFMQGDASFLKDNLTNEKIVAHEMFHHWFGDYVTCESWANLTMNEGFANYSEYLWLEEKHGRDEADYHLLEEMRGYLGQGAVHPLIYYGYADKEDMFDQHSYNKGGMVLHSLRSYIGDEAFFTALNLYLMRNAYTAVEADELRLAVEDVTGEDMIWFFDQWYHKAGHPILNVNYEYNPIDGQAIVMVEQTQSGRDVPTVFQFPVAIDVYVDGKKTRHNVWVKERIQNFEFEVSGEPDLVNFDAQRTLLAEMEDNKTESAYLFQYKNAPLFMDRYEALQGLTASESNAQIEQLYVDALKDPFYGLRAFALSQLDIESNPEQAAAVKALIQNDPKAEVRSAGLDRLIALGDDSYKSLFEEVAENDEAQSVQSTARIGLAALYVAEGDTKNLKFFEDSYADFDYYDAINFFDLYAELASQGEYDEMVATAKKLKPIAMGDSSLWKRFAATKTINTLHGALVQLTEETEGDAARQLIEADGELLQILSDIKEAETDPQLKQVYIQLPQP
ncbi:MAG: M1 family metallopeptidase [Bacteroidota bacterium]